MLALARIEAETWVLVVAAGFSVGVAATSFEVRRRRPPPPPPPPPNAGATGRRPRG
jgi:hypothetical protein